MKQNLCNACPRACNADRLNSSGFCKAAMSFRIARVGLHEWEEPCISYGNGSGTVFFSGCNLKCVFCQNYKISHDLYGKDIDAYTLLNEMKKLEESGAVNINLVNPSHYAQLLVPVLEKFRAFSKLPIVYNSGGYDSVKTLKSLEGLVDIYLPDVKYCSDEYAQKYSNCKGYFKIAMSALEEMHRQTGYAEFCQDGHMKKGVLIRHLVLPSLYKDSISILDAIADKFDASKIALSLMSQYFPTYRACEYPQINRKTTTLEYNKVVEHAKKLGFTRGFVQQRASAFEEYVPEFDYN